jgi:hypothetical protein
MNGGPRVRDGEFEVASGESKSLGEGGSVTLRSSGQEAAPLQETQQA